MIQIVTVLVLVLLVGGAIAYGAHRGFALARKAATEPVVYGRQSPPAPGSTWASTVVINGQPATVSLNEWRPSGRGLPYSGDPLGDALVDHDLRGSITVTMPLGPAWPSAILLPRNPVLPVVDALINRRADQVSPVGAHTIETGNPVLDGGFTTRITAAGDGTAALARFLQPAVLGALAAAPLQLVAIGPNLRVVTLLRSQMTTDDGVRGTVGLVATIVGSIGLPLYSGPPTTTPVVAALNPGAAGIVAGAQFLPDQFVQSRNWTLHPGSGLALCADDRTRLVVATRDGRQLVIAGAVGGYGDVAYLPPSPVWSDGAPVIDTDRAALASFLPAAYAFRGLRLELRTA